jgi:exodeoxyribonuclease VII large subunit
MSGEQELTRGLSLSRPEILSVSALNRSIRDLLEHRYPLLWVAGEVSNYMVAKSGHAYFALKDAQAQVRCVMFRNRGQYLGWTPRDGMQVEVQALVSLYEPRGDFQLTVESMRRAGRGALFEAFLQLREKLEAEGLFDVSVKRPLPAFPRAIGVVTSLQAAALHDVLTTLARRNPAIPVIVYPAPVQGEGAGEKLAAAISRAGQRRECDVILLCRGGGSIEDLWTFNDEALARAIRACPIPVVSGIGHEVDFTIADFAADQRAPTPTAAAELVSPSRQALQADLTGLLRQLRACTGRGLENRMQLLDHLARRLVHPGARLSAQAGVLSHLLSRLTLTTVRTVEERRWRLSELVQRSRARLPQTEQLGNKLDHLVMRLEKAVHGSLEQAATRCAQITASLSHLDPLAVLGRGYSIVQREDQSIVTDAASLSVGEKVAIRFAHGSASARIDKQAG